MFAGCKVRPFVGTSRPASVPPPSSKLLVTLLLVPPPTFTTIPPLAFPSIHQTLFPELFPAPHMDRCAPVCIPPPTTSNLQPSVVNLPPQACHGTMGNPPRILNLHPPQCPWTLPEPWPPARTCPPPLEVARRPVLSWFVTLFGPKYTRGVVGFPKAVWPNLAPLGVPRGLFGDGGEGSEDTTGRAQPTGVAVTSWPPRWWPRTCHPPPTSLGTRGTTTG